MRHPALPGYSHPAPLACLGQVTHVGTLNPSDKGVRGESYEGRGLSFSVHPEDWEAIARLGGGSWWETDLTGRQILEGYQALEMARAGLADWGVREGLLTPCVSIVVSWEDDEWGQRVEMEFPTRQEALEEVEGLEEGEYDLEERPGWAPTRALLEAMGHRMERAGRPSPDALECTLTIWAERNGLDGVWWDDAYDPDRLSAPRGVVFKDKVPGLSFTQVKGPSFRLGRPR